MSMSHKSLTNTPSRGSKRYKFEVKKSTPKHPLEKLLGETVVTAKGDSVSPATFATPEGHEGVIGLYFSAHWCPPCKVFTPRLALFYDEVKQAEKKLEVIFVSFDANVHAFNSYFSEMPWHAVSFSDMDKRENIAREFGIKGIPVLILLDAVTYRPITLNGREVVMLDPLGSRFPWKMPLKEMRPPPVAIVNSAAVSRKASISTKGSSHFTRRSEAPTKQAPEEREGEQTTASRKQSALKSTSEDTRPEDASVA